ncbi:MAG: fumarylacetoacetate hydrolase family protein, partial [Alphaproteobacteria bacterium]|nr:fumarylacetoacetate hydrolase family protein [Alphaproteobacteria bacterium]
KPLLFPRWADSHVAHKQPILRPKESERFDFEGELAVILGKEARRVPLDKALDYVAGYSIYNDGSIRDWQRHTTQYMPGKNYWRSGSFGPCMVTTDEIPDPSKLHLTTRLNGTVVQDEGIDDLIFNVPQLIEYISTFMPLHPGDVIVTGTPSGVGAARTPPLWMKHGDTLEIEISKIGTLTNPVVNE